MEWSLWNGSFGMVLMEWILLNGPYGIVLMEWSLSNGLMSKCILLTCFHSRSSCDGCGGGIEEMMESRNGTCRSLIEYDMLGEDG